MSRRSTATVAIPKHAQPMKILNAVKCNTIEVGGIVLEPGNMVASLEVIDASYLSNTAAWGGGDSGHPEGHDSTNCLSNPILL